MAPVGIFEPLHTALDNEADSIYFGVDQLNMRARASINFTIDDLLEIAKRCEAKKCTHLSYPKYHNLFVIKTLIDDAKEANLYKFTI